MEIKRKIRKNEWQEIPESPEWVILQAHKKIERSILSLREFFMTLVEGGEVNLDHAGWIMYAYDKDSVTGEDLEKYIRTPQPALEIHFYHVPASPVAGVENVTAEPDNEGTMKTELCKVLATTDIGLLRLEMKLMPIAARKSEWTIISITPVEMPNNPPVLSSTKDGSVSTNNTPVAVTPQVLEQVQLQIEAIAEVVVGIESKQFHYRVIPNRGKPGLNPDVFHIIAPESSLN